DHHVDGVDAVQLQLLEEQRLRLDQRGVDLEALRQEVANLGEDLVPGHFAPPCFSFSFSCAMNAARVRTERKISRLRSSSALMRTPYRLLIASASSRASMESRPSPSPNRALSPSICSGTMSSTISVSTMRRLSSASISIISLFALIGGQL